MQQQKRDVPSELTNTQLYANVHRQATRSFNVLAENSDLKEYLTMSIYTVKRLMDRREKDLTELEKYFEDTAAKRRSDKRNMVLLVVLAVFCVCLLFTKRLMVFLTEYLRYKHV
ncbi:hypothetical protein GL50803_008122 [Giardia duodenalis]|uniref:Uncharacterized protein n=2 Tax=Giardia intestinalis TaxID=5741 RepID=A8BMY5_GIAIC|nr:hypothetical protein GL50803_008122 [Giardia intestinalis]ESU36625.1 Hypothetical protein DHA2_8122 [Giardia intestinalis]KAE8305583.1 hypothetical protein GL50803_008122 [Giardia intestinalis]|eukprot:XP_001705988.1 Hypothetical protein GL50803_8122 [Giardia lamblia ATCC 50803]